MKKWDELPVEIQERMLEEQVLQGNKRDDSVFKKKIRTNILHRGFNWGRSKEGLIFWYKVLEGNFDLFFQRYPKQPETFTTSSGLTVWKEEKLMEVWDDNSPKFKRIVFGTKYGKYLSWWDCLDNKKAKRTFLVVPWDYAKEIEPVKTHTLEDLKKILGYDFELKE